MLKDILSISGHSGLFKLVSQGKGNIIVESLNDGKRMPAYATSRISALEDISIFTNESDVKLTNVFVSMFDNQIQIDPKALSSKELKSAFVKVLPDFDQDRVYVSDIKKVFTWYLLLVEKNIINADTIKTYKENSKKEEVESK